ncbi:MAG: hypothetical protein JW738_02510 [Actinobacteria bacterium]|nr:hypothetical protein [Actinomycetota bacterium]
MDEIKLDLPVIGVKQLKDSLNGFENIDRYKGPTWCDVIRLATYGQALIVEPGSIGVCSVSPVVLGLKDAEKAVDKILEPRMEEHVAGYYINHVSRFPDGIEPDTVIIRGRPTQVRIIAEESGELQQNFRGLIGASGLDLTGIQRLNVISALVSNWMIGFAKKWKGFDPLMKAVMSNGQLMFIGEKFIERSLADMSMCRNSTILPLLEDAGNISYFCAGGASWGGNSPLNMTSGYPYRVYKKFADKLNFPGKR